MDKQIVARGNNEPLGYAMLLYYIGSLQDTTNKKIYACDLDMGIRFGFSYNLQSSDA